MYKLESARARGTGGYDYVSIGTSHASDSEPLNLERKIPRHVAVMRMIFCFVTHVRIISGGHEGELVVS